MIKEFVPYDIALALKELGFNEECLTQWGTTSKKLYLTVFKPKSNKHDDVICGDMIAAPLYQQAFRWFREEHKLEGDVSHLNDGRLKWSYVIRNIVDNAKESKIGNYMAKFDSYEEAELACLRKLIEIVNQNKDE
jgi:hypothetical protein